MFLRKKRFGCKSAMMTDGGRGIFLQLAPIVGSYTSVGVGKSMWLFTSTGMLSVVAHREQKKDLLVRARNPSHILEMFPNVAIDEKFAHAIGARPPPGKLVQQNILLGKLHNKNLVK